MQAFGAELSHVGHPSYDVSTLIADLLIWYYIYESTSGSSVERRHFSQTLRDCILEFLSAYFERFDLFVEDSIIERIARLATGFTGVAMLFRYGSISVY